MIYRRSGLYLTPEPPSHVSPQDCAHVALSSVGPDECSLCGDPPTCGATPVPGLAYDRLCYRNTKDAMTDTTALSSDLPPDIFPTAEQTEEAWLRALRLLQANGANIEEMLANGASRMLAVKPDPCPECRLVGTHKLQCSSRPMPVYTTLPIDAEDERAIDALVAKRAAGLKETPMALIAPEELEALREQAREAERLQAAVHELEETVTELESACNERNWLRESLRPILGSREPTPDNVAEVVGHYVEAADAMRRAFELGKAMTAAQHSWCLKDKRRVAERSEPEGRE